MKKLLLIFSVSSLIAVDSAIVVACSSNIIENTRVFSFNEKFLSISKLDTKILEKSGISVPYIYSEDLQDQMAGMIGIPEDHDQAVGETKELIYDNVQQIIMANDFLLQIGSKVPGFEWLINQVRWQSSILKMTDLIFNKNFNMSHVMSGWLENITDYSVSVTFLDDKKDGWDGSEDGNLSYARININQRLLSDASGKVNQNISSSAGLWKVDKSSEKNQIGNAWNPLTKDTALTPEDKKYFGEIGAAYQGFVTSSKLFDLRDKILVKKVQEMQSSVFDFTPSVVDYVNNLNISSDAVNKMLKKNKDKIDSWLEEFLKTNKMFIMDGTNQTIYSNRFSNQVFLRLFTSLLTRFEKDHYNQKELKIAYIVQKRNWKFIDGFFSQYDENIIQDDSVRNKFIDFKNNMSKYKEQDLDKQNDEDIMSLDDAYELTKTLANALFASRNPLGEEQLISPKYISTNVIFQDFKNNLSSKLLDSNVPDAIIPESEKITLGLNNDYKLIVQYFSKKIKDLSLTKDSKFMDTEGVDINKSHWSLWKPDEKKQLSEMFLADLGFKNISFEYRLRDNFLGSFLRKSNENSDWMNEKKSLSQGIFDMTQLKNAVKNLDDDELAAMHDYENSKNDGSWFIDSGLASPLGITNISEYDTMLNTVALGRLFDNRASYMIKNLFTDYKNNAQNKYSMPIWDFNFSSDISPSDWGVANSVVFPKDEAEFKEKFDDDYAFWEYFSLKSNLPGGVPFRASQYTNVPSSEFVRGPFSEFIHNNGLVSSINNKLKWHPFRMVYAQTGNSFGEILDKYQNGEYLKWYLDQNYYKNDITYLFIQTEIISKDPIDMKTIGILKDFWDYFVKNNPNNSENK